MMHDFITTELSVDVLTLFETKPRQRRRLVSTSSSSSDGLNKVFRLCINKDQCDRLLVDSKWPAYISVSEWFFKSAAENNIHQNNIVLSSPIVTAVVNQTGDYDIGAVVPVNVADDTLMDAYNDADADADDDANATVILSDGSHYPTDNCSLNKNGDQSNSI